MESDYMTVVMIFF